MKTKDFKSDYRNRTIKLISVSFSILLSLQCGLLPFQKKSGDNMLTLLLGAFSLGGSSSSNTIPEFRINGYLKSTSSQPLSKHGIEHKSIVNLTNASGYFSLYLNKGDYDLKVFNANSTLLGNFTFTFVDESTTPAVTYSSGAPFVIEWGSITKLPQDTVIPNVGKADLLINELAPGMAANTDYLELFVQGGGYLTGSSVCVRSTCSQLPEVVVASGQYIIFHEGEGINDTLIGEGASATAWDFYGLPSMTTTDSVVYLSQIGATYSSVVIYANYDGTWGGCGSSGNTSCLPPILTAGKWSQALTDWDETDALIPPAQQNYGTNQTILRCPNGSNTSGKSSFILTSVLGERSQGTANVACPGFNLLNAVANSSTSLTITFSAATGTGNNILGNYAIYEGASCSGTQLPISGVAPAGASVNLTTDTQTQGQNYVICVSNIVSAGSVALGGSTAFFSGYSPVASLTLNEIAPAISSSQDYIEIFVLSSGTINGLTLCVRTTCSNFPSRIVTAGQYIIYYEASGSDDTSISDGGFLNAWEFHNSNISMASTDSVIAIKNGATIQSALAYSDGGGTWTGCGSTGDTTCIDPIVTASKWPQAGGSWAENDAMQKSPVGGFTTNDTIVKLPNGSGTDNKSTWSVYTNSALRSTGVANPTPVSVTAGQIVINEIRRQSTGSAHWFELYNTTTSSVDLGSAGLRFYRIGNCDAAWTTNTANSFSLAGTIPANGYFVVGIGAGIPGNEDFVGNFSSLTDNNCVFLTKSATRPSSLADSSIIDFVGWGTATAYSGSGQAANLTNGSVLQRFPNGNTDTNNNTAFSLLTSCAGSSKITNTASCLDSTPPTIFSTNPANAATGVSINSTIAITFSEAMNTSSITTNTSNTTCSGSIQVSSDGFTTCIQMNAIPAPVGNVFTLTPSSAMSNSTSYSIRVTTAVQDSANNSMTAQYNGSFTTGAVLVNLITNGSFESDTNSCDNSNTTTPVTISGTCPNGWTIYTIDSGTRTFLVTDNPAFSQAGNRYMNMNHYTATYGNRVVASNCFAIDDTQGITMKGWARKSNTTNTPTFRFRIRTYDDAGCSTNEIDPSGANPSALTISSLDTWTEHTFTRPSTDLTGKTHARLFIEMRGGSTANLFLDNISATQP
jgi:hypothetical protein